ncbi:MAG: indole-3-glycerol phosphate synthase TrpC, partial [Elusimicrobiota bacterium]
MLENKVLTDIIEYKRETVLKKKKQISEKELEDIIKDLPPPRDFLKAVSSGDYLNVIAEIKKASPSAGIIKNDFDPAQLASEIQTAGASAISVLTEEKYFQGDLYHLVGVHQAVELPVLRKDFIIDEYQVIESRAYNADAV